MKAAEYIIIVPYTNLHGLRSIISLHVAANGRTKKGSRVEKMGLTIRL